MSQAINIRAVQWAIEQDGLSVTQKAILMTFAVHADDQGYTYPSKERMRFIWGMDPTTIREGTERLVIKKLLRSTKKKRGWTRQVDVFRLPKVAWESSGKSHTFKNEKGARKVWKIPQLIMNK